MANGKRQRYADEQCVGLWAGRAIRTQLMQLVTSVWLWRPDILAFISCRCSKVKTNGCVGVNIHPVLVRLVLALRLPGLL